MFFYKFILLYSYIIIFTCKYTLYLNVYSLYTLISNNINNFELNVCIFNLNINHKNDSNALRNSLKYLIKFYGTQRQIVSILYHIYTNNKINIF